MISSFTDVESPANSSVIPSILNDTSLAAAILTNGDRHLFFQGAKGSLHRVVHTAATSQWILDRTPVVISDARHLTPMAVYTKGPPGAMQVGTSLNNKHHNNKHDNTNVID